MRRGMKIDALSLQKYCEVHDVEYVAKLLSSRHFLACGMLSALTETFDLFICNFRNELLINVKGETVCLPSFG